MKIVDSHKRITFLIIHELDRKMRQVIAYNLWLFYYVRIKVNVKRIMKNIYNAKSI